MMYHFYLKNSEPVYETEYTCTCMQSLKQFAVQEVLPTYVLKGPNKNSIEKYAEDNY